MLWVQQLSTVKLCKTGHVWVPELGSLGLRKTGSHVEAVTVSALHASARWLWSSPHVTKGMAYSSRASLQAEQVFTNALLLPVMLLLL